MDYAQKCCLLRSESARSADQKNSGKASAVDGYDLGRGVTSLTPLRLTEKNNY